MPREATEDLTVYANKPATDLQQRFAEWIPAKTGYDPSSAKSKQEAFNEGVRLATAMRMIFQASPENKAANAARKAKAANEVEEQEQEEQPKKAAPAKRAAKRAAKKAAPAKRTRRAAPQPEDDEAPF